MIVVFLADGSTMIALDRYGVAQRWLHVAVDRDSSYSCNAFPFHRSFSKFKMDRFPLSVGDAALL